MRRLRQRLFNAGSVPFWLAVAGALLIIGSQLWRHRHANS